MNLFSGQSESRELLRKLDDRHDSPQLTLAQVGLGQSRGYLLVREMPDGSPLRRWCILKDERLWFFEAPDSAKAGTSLPLENAVISEGTRRRSSDPNSCFEVRTAGGRHYLMQAKSSGGNGECSPSVSIACSDARED